jgi:hypothetical protein
MKTFIRAALVASSLIASGLAFAPAMAAEGNSEPFPLNAGSFTTHSGLTRPRVADTGSEAYPNLAGRPGSDLPALAGDVLPTNGSEGIVQTANSLPAHFEDGTVAYAQATRIHNWMLAHARQNAPTYAAAAPRY